MADTWQAADAIDRFDDLIDAAVGGQPQFVDAGYGEQVVVISLDYFEKTCPGLKGYLLTKGVSDTAEDAFDRAMRAIRSEEEHRFVGDQVPVYEDDSFAEDAARLRARAPCQATDSADLIRIDRDRDHQD